MEHLLSPLLVSNHIREIFTVYSYTPSSYIHTRSTPRKLHKADNTISGGGKTFPDDVLRNIALALFTDQL